MWISLSWLKDLVAVPNAAKSGEIAARLTHAGLEVEELKELGAELGTVQVAEVVTCERHPNADRLSLCKVDTGKEVLSVVCGAPNVRQGQKIAFAPVGTQLPGGMQIKRTKIRGENSEGMICSESELGLSTESQGILVLPDSWPKGRELREIEGLRDTVFSVAVTPNRADGLSHLGMARELRALFGWELKPLPKAAKRAGAFAPTIAVRIEDRTGCPAYRGSMVRGVTVIESPFMIQRRLRGVGLRPINQIVDATNYVLMELGQPTHAFDARQIRGAKIIVRRAHPGETLKTLDGKSYVLRAHDLVIADGERAVALAGVMGGEEASIHPDTTELFLECAYFEPTGIRRTARSLGIITDSSYRFERGVDPEGVERAIGRLEQLLTMWSTAAGGEPPQLSARTGVAMPKKRLHRVKLSTAYVAARLGKAYAASEIKKTLADLGITAASKKQGEFHCEIPSYRADLTRPIDLVEEVARIKGYDTIPEQLPATALRPLPLPESVRRGREATATMTRHGFSEAIHYAFVPADEMKQLGYAPDDALQPTLKLLNPIAEDQQVLRTALLPSLLRAVAYNLNRGLEAVRLFEQGKCYFRDAQRKSPVREQLRLGVVMSGRAVPLQWGVAERSSDIFDLKGALEELLHRRFNPQRIRFVPPATLPFLHPGQAAQIVLHSETRQQIQLGWIGAVHPEVLARFGIESAVFACEVDFDLFCATEEGERSAYRPVPVYPGVRRDLALVVAEELTAQAVYDLIWSSRDEVLDSVELFDVYRGPQVPQGKKSMAFAIQYISSAKTLTHEEVDRLHQQLVERLRKTLGAELRT